MQALQMLISSPWFWASLALSGVGGVIVAWGLRVEKLAERKLPPTDFKTDIFEDVVEEAKRGVEHGWRILMTGIIFEVVAAFAISIISGLEVANLTLEARQAGKDAGDAKVFAAQIGITNAQLVATNLLFAKEVLTLAQQVQDTAKTAIETRNLLGDANTTARLNETKTVLAEANKVATDVRSVVTSSNLAAFKITSPDRTITPEQETKLIVLLKPWTQANFMLNKTVNISVELSDFEAVKYANKINNVLKECGFDPKLSEGISVFNGEVPTGLEVFSGRNSGSLAIPQSLAVIKQAFVAARIEVQSFGAYTNVAVDGSVNIKVWHKPDK